ncbi:tetraacyldisaccharide 4'-kinase [bacterium]|nr:tetraacyldisaccharide 4'-kinase [bacterium]
MKRAWPLLAPFSLLYSAGVGLRNLLYDRGTLRTTDSGVAVLSVGNITAGGSGKSPLTIELCGRLRALAPDLPIVVVSRGYGRRTKGPQVVADGTTVFLTPDLGGDEPVMIAEALHDVPVIVSERRVDGVALAVEQFGAKLVILDDGFQHRRIARDLDVVLIDAAEPDWIWRPLPAGRLRELPTSLRRANMVVMTGRAPQERRDQLAAFVRKQSEAELIGGGAWLAQVRDHETGESFPVEQLHGKRVAAACGIARPERFFDELESLGIEVIQRTAWRDHAWTTSDQRANLMNRAREVGAEALLITAKDAVKWPRGEEGLPVQVPELRWKWEAGEAELDACLQGFVERARAR